MFYFLCGILAALAQRFLIEMDVGLTFDFDLASGFVPNDRVLTVPGSKIATVAVNDIFLTGQLGMKSASHHGH